jgi:hypothetical protein
MIIEQSKVKTKGKVVGTINIDIYDTMEEAVNALTPELALKLLNKANKVRLQGEERNRHKAGRGTKDALRAAAFKLMTTEEITAFGGDYKAMQAHLDSPEMQEKAREVIAAANPEAEDTDEVEDTNEAEE